MFTVCFLKNNYKKIKLFQTLKGKEKKILLTVTEYIYIYMVNFQPLEEITSLFLNSQYSKPKFFPSLCICFR